MQLSPENQKLEDYINWGNLLDAICIDHLKPNEDQIHALKAISERQRVAIPQEVIDKLNEIGIEL